ncbi:MAG: hypothetical protein VYB77_04070, partial [Planctomycetota bacterium]|nr:hypothetical protein [Planctomycetota bacterium]
DKADPGQCGCGIAETDSDGDGVSDCIDGCPGMDDLLDTDQDGTPDCLDGCPEDPNTSTPGVCGCGVDDSDADGDGLPDCLFGKDNNCPAGQIPDCDGSGECGPANWLGDGFCDGILQDYDLDFCCYAFDGGDCDPFGEC